MKMKISSKRFSPARAACYVTLIALLVHSCKDAGVGPGGGGGGTFAFKITVTNTAGQAVQGLMVSVRSEMYPVYPVFKGASNERTQSVRSIQAVTSIGFDVPILSHVNLSVFEMDGTPVSTLMERARTVPGSYRVSLDVPASYGTRVYKCRLTASDTASGALLYRDSIYAVVWNQDTFLSAIGNTSAAGTYQTQDTLLFPGVLNLPTLIQTDATGPTLIGYFRISDSLTVTLTDTVARKSQSVIWHLQNGSNDIHVLWNPPPGPQIRGPVPRGQAAPAAGSDVEPLPAPTSWKLYQNYPNPFN